MTRRKTLISAALVGSVGIALIPALAQASTSAQTAAQLPTSSHSSGSAANTGPNPNLAVSFTTAATGAFGATVSGTVTGLTTGSATATVNCGTNSTTGITNVPVSSMTDKFTSSCTFSKLGQANSIVVSVDDGQGDTNSQTQSNVQTAGSYYVDYGPRRILDTVDGINATMNPVAPDATLKLKVVGLGSAGGHAIPAGVTAVALNVTAVAPAANGYLTAYANEDQSGNRIPNPGTSNLNFFTGQNVANLVIVPVGKDGIVDFYNGSKGSTNLIADLAGYFTPTLGTDQNVSFSGYTPIAPARIVDTRTGAGTGGTIAQIPSNGSITVHMDGVDGIGTGATSVAMNLTVVDGTRNGVITAYPNNPGVPLPTVSNLNYTAGHTASNMAIVTTSVLPTTGGTAGNITFHNDGKGSVDLIVDAVGYYGAQPTPGGTSAYVPLQTPSRFLDTRTQGGPLPTLKPIDLPGTSFSYETADVFNATLVGPTGNGYLSVYPFNPNDPSFVPSTSNLNYLTNQTIPNLVLASPGTVENMKTSTYDFGLYLGGKGTAQLILDKFGYFANE